MKQLSKLFVGCLAVALVIFSSCSSNAPAAKGTAKAKGPLPEEKVGWGLGFLA